jgi:hypothetical protein
MILAYGITGSGNHTPDKAQVVSAFEVHAREFNQAVLTGR